MAVRRADSTLFARMRTLQADAKQLEIDLRRHGDRELADVAKRAYRELSHPAFTGAANQQGQ
jgi:hypothetical protein